MKNQLKTYCFVTMEYPEETGFGGIGTYVWHMAHALQESGVQVTVFTCSPRKNQLYKEDSIRVIRKKLGTPVLLWWYFEVTKFLIQHRFDMVEDADFLGSAFFYQLFCKRKTDFFHIKLHTPHKIVNYYENKNSFIERMKTEVMNFIESINAKKSDMISSPSEIMKQIIGIVWNIADTKIHSISYPFSVKGLKIIEPPISGKYLLYFGRLQQRKSADLLLLLIKKDFLKKRKMKFIIIGKDLYHFKDKLIKINNYSAKNTFLKDFTANKSELYGYIKNASVVFLPSKFDNSPLTVLESLWFNPQTFVLANSGPLEMMANVELSENVIQEEDLLKNPEILFDKKTATLQKKIQKNITNSHGYKKIAEKYKFFYENK